MVTNVLIDAYVAELSRALPPTIVDELADGLLESYEHQLERGCSDVAAARAAIGEFGEVDTVVREFTRQAAGRRTARALLATGPAVGACWGIALVATRAWSWPVPLVARAAFGSVLLLAIGALLGAATRQTSYRRTRLAAALGGTGLVILDMTLILASSLAAPVFRGVLIVGVGASAARIVLTVRSLPSVLAR